MPRDIIAVHRFRKLAGVAIDGVPGTRYLTADECDALSIILRDIAQDIRLNEFRDSRWRDRTVTREHPAQLVSTQVE